MRREILNQLELISGNLKNAREIGFNEHAFVDGSVVGFPGQADTSSYLSYVQEKSLPGIEARIGRLNQYLEEEKAGVESA